MAQRILRVVALAVCLGQPGVVRAQLTGPESVLFNKLLAEPDGKESFEKRLRLIEQAIEREADPKWRPASSIPVDLKRARIPAVDGVEFLLNRLDHSSEAVRRTVVRMLGAYGAEAKAAVPSVLERMKREPIRAVRCDVMLTLAKIEPTNAASADAILDRLGADDADDVINRAALQALIAMAAAVPKSAAPRIAKFHAHRATDLGVLAHELIGKMHALERPNLEQLRALTAIEWQKTPDQGYAVFAAIGDAGAKADFAVPLLLGVLDADPPPYLQCVAVDALMKVRTGNPRAIAALLGRLGAKDLLVRTKSRTALHVIDLKQPESVRALTAGLRHDDPVVRLAVAGTLRTWDDTGRLPPAAHAEMLPPVLEALGEGEDKLFPNHLEAYLLLLRRFGTRAAPVADRLVKLYQSEAYFKKFGSYGMTLRGKILATLANVGVPQAGRELVLEVLRKGPGGQPDGGFAYAAAARAAATFGPPKEVVPLLMPGLAVKGPERALYFIDWSGDGLGKPTTVRREAVLALAKFGPAAEEALPLLREIVEGKAEKRAFLDLLVQQEARRAYKTIAGTPLPPTKGMFADGKQETLHLDERLHVKLTLKLRNPRPQDVLTRLEQATKLKFTMAENIDPDTPVWASSHSVQVSVYQHMRQLARSSVIQGTWEDIGDGYRLVGKERPPNEKPIRTAKGPFPPFRDDSNDPLPDDPRLKKSLTVRLHPTKVQLVLQQIQDATGVPLTVENVNGEMDLSSEWQSVPAWAILRSIAENPRIQGTWVKAGDGYRLRGTRPPQPIVIRRVQPAPPPPPTPVTETTAPNPNRRFMVLLAGLVMIMIVGAGAAVWLHKRKERHAN